MLMAVGAGVNKDPTIARNSKCFSFFNRTHNERCAHIDVIVRVHELRIRKANHAVIWAGSANIFCTHCILRPGIGVLRRNVAEA